MTGLKTLHSFPLHMLINPRIKITSSVIIWLYHNEVFFFFASTPPPPAYSSQLYKLNIHNVVSEFVPLIMSTIMLQVSPQAR